MKNKPHQVSAWCSVDIAEKKQDAGDVQGQCWAVTQSGARCKRRARPGARYCKQHSADVTPKKAPERCRSMTENGGQCSEKPVPGKNYCEKHLKSELQAVKPH